MSDEPLAVIERTVELVSVLTRQQLRTRFKGSVFGGSWMVLNPLLTIVLLSFVFGELLQVRWGADATIDYPLALFGGLIVHFFISDCVTRGPTLVTANPQYVHKIVFPLPLLAVVTVLDVAVVFVVALILFLAVAWVSGYPPQLVWLWLPVAVLPLAFYGLGIGWLMSAVGVFVKDLTQISGQISTGLLLLSPILYPIAVVPESVRGFYYLNPSTAIVDNLRLIVFGADAPAFGAIAVPLVAAVVFAALGFALFAKLQNGFADVV